MLLAKKQGLVQNKGNVAFCYYRYSSSAQRDCSIDQQKEAAWKVDRLSRDKALCNDYKRIIKNAGCKIIYVAEYVPDCDDGSAVIVESIYEAMAQMFIEQHKKNVKRGLDHNAARCLYNGQKTLGYIG